jgi:histidinol-phosphate aminotransferase
MAHQLAELPGVSVHQPAAAPFLLLRVPGGGRVRAALADVGIAVRRADTFPGLTADHLRVAVRPPEIAGLLVEALREELAAAEVFTL